MSDFSELKKLAEAAQAFPFADEACEFQALSDFYDGCDPAEVLVLIAENERLRADLDGEISQARDFNIEHEELKSERDHLKAENESLRRQAETAQRGAGQLQEENEALRGLYQMHKATETREMRDLKAQLAGLKTGYEAYERVNAQLKAEVEKLRKERDARHPFKPFHEPSIGFTGCVICGVYTDHGGLPCPRTRATADAAMGQGEQS